jgi:hypothetical protein
MHIVRSMGLRMMGIPSMALTKQRTHWQYHAGRLEITAQRALQAAVTAVVLVCLSIRMTTHQERRQYRLVQQWERRSPVNQATPSLHRAECTSRTISTTRHVMLEEVSIWTRTMAMIMTAMDITTI